MDGNGHVKLVEDCIVLRAKTFKDPLYHADANNPRTKGSCPRTMHTLRMVIRNEVCK
jgi:hypothetical protein